MQFSRRHLLKMLGMGGAALATGRVRPAHAQEAGPVRRLILLSTNHGVAHEGFRMDFGGRPDDAAWDASLVDLPEAQWSRVLQPLYRHRHHLLPIDGLSMATAELDMDGYRHEKGQMHAWTGQFAHFTGDALYAGGRSLDQIVARAIARPDQVPSLELAVGPDARDVSHGGLALPLPLARSPRAAFDRMFGVKADPFLASSSSILDFVTGEFEAGLSAVKGADAERLAAHRDLVKDLGARLQGLGSATCPAGDSLSPPGASASYGETLAAHFDSVVAGMACDLVRVAMISFGDIPGELLPQRPGSGDVHDSWAHGMYDRADNMAGMVDYAAAHAEHMAQLLDRLAATPDPQGGSLLDHTLVVWTNELGDGWHGYARLSAVVAGGGWHFSPGRYVHHPYGINPIEVLVHPSQDARGFQRSGVPHQHLLVSVAQAMGLDLDHVGLKDVRAQDGTRVDLTGPLAGLTGRLS